MRRAWWLVLALASRPAHASPWTWSLEAGGEADTNIERVETDAASNVQPISALVMRTGARVDYHDRLLGGTLGLATAGSTRVVTNDRVETSPEDIGLIAADARWVHPLGERPVGLGVALQAADAFALDADIGDRTFRNLGADALVVMRASDTRRLTLALGGRQFVYKPARVYDYAAPSASLRLDLVLWATADGTRTLELASTLGFEARAFDSTAAIDTCPPGVANVNCSGASSFLRRDSFQRADIAVTYSGARVASLGYQLVVIDSNSYGQSLVRHRITASGTTPLAPKLYLSAIATLQIDQYPDGLLIATDSQHTEFSNLEDENRSAVQVRVGRYLSETWTFELRGALWRDLSIGTGAMSGTQFHRELLYAGLVYNH